MMRSDDDPQQQSEEEVNFDHNIDSVPVDLPENIPAPPSDAVLLPPPEWIDPNAETHNWFNEMVDAHPDVSETEEPVEGSVIDFAKRLKKVMNTQKLQLSDLMNIRKSGFTEFKTCTTTQLEFEYNVEEVARAMSEKITWEKRTPLESFYYKPEDLQYTDFSQPLPMLGRPNDPKIPKQFFFNKDLYFFVHGNNDPAHRYATSLTKFKAAFYPIEELEDQLRGLHSKQVQKYDTDAVLGILHWPETRRLYYKYKLSVTSRKTVFSNHRLLSVRNVKKIDNRFGYPFLDEIEVRRSDDELYTFSEADYDRLNRDDLFDIYLLKRQGKLENLPGNTQYDVINSILLAIRRTVLKARVEDAQLGAESYQTQLNFTEHRISHRYKQEPLTFVKKPFGVVYQKGKDRQRFMDYNEVHKFGDQTLKFVGIELNKKLAKYDKGSRVGWNRQDAKEARKFMVRIEQKLRFRDQIRRLESLVGGREPIQNILTYRRPSHRPYF
jgi:hypothetical protein